MDAFFRGVEYITWEKADKMSKEAEVIDCLIIYVLSSSPYTGLFAMFIRPFLPPPSLNFYPDFFVSQGKHPSLDTPHAKFTNYSFDVEEFMQQITALADRVLERRVATLSHTVLGPGVSGG